MTWQVILIHVLAYPIYQIVGTFRHEACHALAALSFGADILEFKIFPGRRDGSFYWGYVRWQAYDMDRDQRILILHFPYLVDILLIATGILTFYLYEIPNVHWRLFAIVMLIVSPSIDLLYNLLKWIVWGRGDFAEARK